MDSIKNTAEDLQALRARALILWDDYIHGRKEATPLWCPFCDIDFEMSAAVPRCPVCGQLGISSLNRLDERKVKARRDLAKANPKPRAFRGGEVETAQIEWKEVFDDASSADYLPMLLRGGLRSPSRVDVWLFQGGEQWLQDLIIAKGWDVRVFYQVLSESAPNKKVRKAAKELAKLPKEYALAGWKGAD
jgi:hypothetical protein